MRVNFLPVGHTHEDIDQLFSRISKQLTLKGAESLPGNNYAFIIIHVVCRYYAWWSIIIIAIIILPINYKFIKVGFELIVTLHNYCCMYNCTDLQKQITQSSTPTPTVEVLNTISDVRSWLEPCIDGLNGHSLPHCFKFFLEDGKAVMYFRHWSSDAWCNADVAVKLLLASPHVITFFCQ